MTTISRAISGRRQALYLSISVAATGTHNIFYPYIFDAWTQQYGLNGTWLLTGALMLNVWALPIMLCMNRGIDKINKTESNGKAKPEILTSSDLHYDKSVPDNGISFTSIEMHSATGDSENKMTTWPTSTAIIKETVTMGQTCAKYVIKQCDTNIPLALVIFGTAITIGSYNAFTSVMMDIFKWKGYSVNQTLPVFIPSSIFHILSRLVTGLIKQRRGINTYVFPMLAIIGGIVGQTLILHFDNFIVLSIGATLNAITNGGVISTAVVLVVKLSKDGSPLGTGLLFTSEGISSAALSPLFGTTFYICILFLSGYYNYILL